MHSVRPLLAAAVLLLGACGLNGAAPPAPVPAGAGAPADTDLGGLLTYRELLARPQTERGERIAYGAGPQQFGEMWLPRGPGPHPVVVMIHGGCWQAALPGLELQHELSRALRDEGYAVWNVEYRRLGHEGGGYPGTFQDAAAATDHLRTLARSRPLDLSRVVTVGHSAGGHLASWVAARPRLPTDSPLRSADPLPVAGAVSLAGIDDLAAYRADGPDACGGPDTIDRLVDARGRAGRDVYADTSLFALAPTGARLRVITGGRDPIVPSRFGWAFAERARQAGDDAEYLNLPEAGHFELIDPRSAAWPRVLAAVDALSGRNRR